MITHTFVVFTGILIASVSGVAGGSANSYGGSSSTAGSYSSAGSGGFGGGGGGGFGVPYGGGYSGGAPAWFPDFKGFDFGSPAGCQCGPNFGFGMDPAGMQNHIQEQIRRLQDYNFQLQQQIAGGAKGGFPAGGAQTNTYGSYGGGSYAPSYGGAQGYGHGGAPSGGPSGFGSANANAFAGPGTDGNYQGGGTGLDVRFGSEDSAPAAGGDGKFFGISSSSQSSSSNIDGKTETRKQASVTVNDNGKVTTYNSP